MTCRCKELETELARVREALGRYRGAVSWLEPLFVGEQTPAYEIKARIRFCIEDAERARAALGEGSQ